MKIEIKNRWTNQVIYSHECENNTISKTVQEAVKNKISLRLSDLSGSNLSDSDLSGSDLSDSNLSWSNLRRSDLSGSDLRRSDLSWSNLRRSDLSGSDLRRSDLRRSDLSGSDLSGSNLSGSNLSDSNLSGSNLSDSNLSGSNLSDTKMPMYCKWSMSIINNSIIKIGCKEKTIKDWEEWFENSSEEFDTKRDSEDFKRIKAMFYAHKTYLEILNK